MGKIAENKGKDISKNQLADILNKQFKTVDENDIPDEVSTEHDIVLTTTDDKYTINLSKIYNGKFLSNDENEIVERNPAEWETNEEGDTLTKYLGTSKNIIIPNKLNGKYITTIGNALFNGKNIETLKISNGITTIGAGAFAGCTDLSGTLTLPDSIVTINAAAFQNCSQLTGRLIIPKGVNTIGPSAFLNCGITSLEILSESNISLGKLEFGKCKNITSAYISNGVTTIDDNGYTGNNPFYSCSQSLKIYCQAESKPAGWNERWNAYDINNGIQKLEVKWRKNNNRIFIRNKLVKNLQLIRNKA